VAIARYHKQVSEIASRRHTVEQAGFLHHLVMLVFLGKNYTYNPRRYKNMLSGPSTGVSFSWKVISRCEDS
jgi:hypothetical protein